MYLFCIKYSAISWTAVILDAGDKLEFTKHINLKRNLKKLLHRTAAE